jgi:hypothetical protein
LNCASISAIAAVKIFDSASTEFEVFDQPGNAGAGEICKASATTAVLPMPIPPIIAATLPFEKIL